MVLVLEVGTGVECKGYHVLGETAGGIKLLLH